MFDHALRRDPYCYRFDSCNTFYATSEKETLEVIGLILAKSFYTTSENETLEVVGSILASPFYNFYSG